MNASTLASLDRLAVRRRETVAAGIDGALAVLTNPLASQWQRAAWGETYLRCVDAQLRLLDDEAWALTVKALSA